MPKRNQPIRFLTRYGGESRWHEGRFIHRGDIKSDVFQSDAEGKWFGTALVFDWAYL